MIRLALKNIWARKKKKRLAAGRAGCRRYHIVSSDGPSDCTDLCEQFAGWL